MEHGAPHPLASSQDIVNDLQHVAPPSMKLRLFGRKDKAVPIAPAPAPALVAPASQGAERRSRQRSPQLDSPPPHSRSTSSPTSPVIAPTLVSRSQFTAPSRSTSRAPGGCQSSEVYSISSSNWLEDPALAGDGKIQLRVVVDPIAVPGADAAWSAPSEPFTFEVNAWTPIDELRSQLAARLGTDGKYALGCYKVGR